MATRVRVQIVVENDVSPMIRAGSTHDYEVIGGSLVDALGDATTGALQQAARAHQVDMSKANRS